MYVVCCDPGTKAALGKAPSGADVRLMDAKNLPPAKVGDVQVVITPVGTCYFFVFKRRKWICSCKR